MSARGSASRYARALLDVAILESIPDRAGHELAEFVQLLDANPELKKVLLNPAVPVTGKRGLVNELVVRMKPSVPVGKLLGMLAERDRLTLLPDLLSVYRERLMDHHQIVRADVTTAAPMEKDRAAQLERRLADVTGRTVTMTTMVDPSIIGGVIARIGSTVYDGSVATQLEKVRQKLVQRS